MNSSSRPSLLVTTAGVPAHLPGSGHHALHGDPGAVWKACISVPSAVTAKTSSRPSALLAAAQPASGGKVWVPIGTKPDHWLLGASCHELRKRPSAPMTNASRRPSRLRVTAGVPVALTPRDNHPDQPLLGASCQLSCSVLSDPTMKISSRPSALLKTAGPTMTLVASSEVTHGAEWVAVLLSVALVLVQAGSNCHGGMQPTMRQTTGP